MKRYARMALIGPSKENRAFWKERGARDRYVCLLAPELFEKVDREFSELYADVVVAKVGERLRERARGVGNLHVFVMPA